MATKERWCCFSCGQFGHYAIDCTQGTCEEQETIPSHIISEDDKAQEPSKEFLKVKACSHCGEIGHYVSDSLLNAHTLTKTIQLKNTVQPGSPAFSAKGWIMCPKTVI
uniref:CCHC-type domain-containing protein n=1 Tax=Oryza punctata TaxID=4537 RepID=A0A0E0LZD9_ORYPU